MRKEQAPADFAVRQPFGGELRDLQLLGGEALTGVRRAAADRLDRRSQLMSSTPLLAAQAHSAAVVTVAVSGTGNSWPAAARTGQCGCGRRAPVDWWPHCKAIPAWSARWRYRMMGDLTLTFPPPPPFR
jgi:hypothetical protein